MKRALYILSWVAGPAIAVLLIAFGLDVGRWPLVVVGAALLVAAFFVARSYWREPRNG